MLSRIGIASLELREPGFDSIWPAKYPPVWPHLRPLFDKVFILNSEFTRDKAEAALAEAEADAISFGRPFIANPDLPARLRTGGRLSDADADKYYEGAEKGYIDYPPLQAAELQT